MKCEGIQYREFSEEQIEKTRDSVFGYNDELAYAILEGQNAGQYVLGHIRNYNFNSNFDYLYQDRFKHEFAHVLLGLSFLKRDKNPLPFEYGYDGNGMAESLVIPLEDLFEPPSEYNQKSKKAYTSQVLEIFNRTKGQINSSYHVATKLCNLWDEAISIFEMRKRHGFVSPSEGALRFESSSQKTDKKTKWGEKTYRGQALPRHIAESFYDDVKPVVKFVQRNFQRLLDDESIPIDGSMATRNGYMKMIPVSILWDVMNEPELADTIDLNHQELLTWEFALRHVDPVKNVFSKFCFLQGENARLENLNCPITHSGAYAACDLMRTLSWPMEKICIEICDINYNRLDEETKNKPKSLHSILSLSLGDNSPFAEYGMSMIQNGVKQTYQDILTHRARLTPNAESIQKREEPKCLATPSP